MRLVLATAAAALVAVPAALAAPPSPLKGYPVIILDRAKTKSSLATCTAPVRSRATRVQRRLITVACEQPPRANVRQTIFGTYFSR